MKTETTWITIFTAIFIASIILFSIPLAILIRRGYVESINTSYKIYYNDTIIYTPNIWMSNRKNCVYTADNQVICGDFRIETVTE